MSRGYENGQREYPFYRNFSQQGFQSYDVGQYETWKFANLPRDFMDNHFESDNFRDLSKKPSHEDRRDSPSNSQYRTQTYQGGNYFASSAGRTRQDESLHASFNPNSNEFVQNGFMRREIVVQGEPELRIKEVYPAEREDHTKSQYYSQSIPQSGYQSNQSSHTQLGLPPRVTKSNFQRNLPIIYNSFNPSNEPPSERNLTRSRQKGDTKIIINHVGAPARPPQPQGFQIIQKPYGEQYFEQRKVSSFPISPQNHDPFNHQRGIFQQTSHRQNQQIHTFHRLPSDSEPITTAKFIQTQKRIQEPQQMVNSYTEQYRIPQQIIRQPLIVQSHNYMNFSPQPPNLQRNFIEQTRIRAPTPPRVREVVTGTLSPRLMQEFPAQPHNFIQPQRMAPQNHQLMTQSIVTGAKTITIGRQEYQKFVQHMSSCKQKQGEYQSVVLKYQQSLKKQKFLQNENETLRVQNRKLREKALQNQKIEKQNVQKSAKSGYRAVQEIERYRESLLQECMLLIQRFRLQSRKNV